jgi:CheY-like chemotaxis protein
MLRGVRVLVIDPDGAARRAAFVALETEGAVPTVVGAVETGLAFACLLHPDVIVVDLAMQDDGGWRLAEALRKREREAAIPVVATSAEPVDGEAAVLGGFAGFVPKPFDAGALCVAVATAALEAAVRDPAP